MKETMDCYKAQRISHGLIFGGIACMMIPLLGGQRLFLLAIMGWIVMFGGMLFGWVYVRCPHCGKSLTNGRMPAVPDYCPHCGARLNKES